jgi:hypothetical protein
MPTVNGPVLGGVTDRVAGDDGVTGEEMSVGTVPGAPPVAALIDSHAGRPAAQAGAPNGESGSWPRAPEASRCNPVKGRGALPGPSAFRRASRLENQ